MSATTHGRRRDVGRDPMADGPRSLGRRARWALALRLARREVRLHPWRHALVVAMVFVPVLAAFGSLSAVRSWQATEARSERFASAGADLRIPVALGEDRTAPTAPTADDLDAARTAVPPGAEAEGRWTSADWLVTETERTDGRGPLLIGLSVASAADGSRSAERYVVTEGRLARTGDEILLSPAVADAGPWQVGDTVTSARSERRFTVVGIGAAGDDVEAYTAAVGPVPEDYWLQPASGIDDVRTPTGGWLNALPRYDLLVYTNDGVGGTDLDAGGAVLIGGSSADTDAQLVPGITLAAAALCALVSVVASAAFAIASRRQLRTVGLLAVAGADPGVVRATLVLQGAIPGLVAGLAGIAVGAAAIAGANRRGAAVRLWDVAGAELLVSVPGAVVAVLLAVFSGTLAAWQPARTASRIPVLSALAGRRPLPPVRTRVPIAGAVCLAAGALALAATTRLAATDPDAGRRTSLLLPVLAVGGVAAVALGTVGLAPALVAGLGRLAGRIGGTSRLALRGLARHRVQSAATIAAVAVALSLPIGLLTNRAAERDLRQVSSSDDHVEEATPREVRPIFQPESLVVQVGGDRSSAQGQEAITSVDRLLGPRAAAIVITPFVDDRGEWIDVAAVPPEAMGALAPWARRRLSTGQGITLDGRAGHLELRAGERRVRVDGQLPPGGAATYVEGLDASLVVSTATLGDLGAGRPASSLVSVRSGPATEAEVATLRSLVQGSSGIDSSGTPTLDDVRRASTGSLVATSDAWISSPTIQPRYEPAGADDDRARQLLLLAAASTVLALLVLTITLSLRGVDTQDDLRAAVAVGAPPALLRRLRALEGVVLAGLGALLAVPVGWLAITGFRAGQVRSGNRRPGTVAAIADRIHVPGWEVLPVLLVPVALTALAWLVVPAVVAAVRPRSRDVLLPRS